MSKSSHSFSVDIAAQEGLIEAILLQHIYFLQTSFVEKDQSASDVWVKRSVKAYQITYPYLTPKQISGAFSRMEERGLIRSKIDNKVSYDRTKSVQVTKKGWAYFEENAFAKRENGNSEKENGFEQKENGDGQKGNSVIGNCSSFVDSVLDSDESKADKPQPTPKNEFSENEIHGESNLNENPKNPNSFTGGAAKNSDAGKISEVVNFLNETVKPACNFRQSSKTTAGHIRQRVAEGFSVSDICIVIEHKTSQWRNDPKMSEYLRPATLFGTGKFESYLVAARTWEKSGKKSATNSGGYQNQSRSVTTDFGADKDKFQQPQIF